MEENTVGQYQTEKTIPVFKILFKNLILIVLVTVLAALLGLSYSLSQVPPTYTATHSLILCTEIQDGEYETSQQANQATLAKRYFSTVEKLIKSPKFINEVNEKYQVEGQKVTSGSLDMSYGEKSLIFRISYTDKTEELAEAKLKTLMETLSLSETLQQGIMADNVRFLPTQVESDVVENTQYVKFTLIGAAIGLVISVAIAFLVYMLDNTIKDKKEFEELTGVNVIAYINKEKPKKKNAVN